MGATRSWVRWMALLLVAAPVMAENRLSWTDFSMLMKPNQTFRLALPDATVIEGRPVEMRPDGMVIRITRTSDRRAHPKGTVTVPREAVSVVEVRKPRSVGKIIGTLAPIGVGIAIAASAANEGDEMYVNLVAGGLTMAVGGVGGFFVGRAIDRRFERFVIAPRQ